MATAVTAAVAAVAEASIKNLSSVPRCTACSVEHLAFPHDIAFRDHFSILADLQLTMILPNMTHSTRPAMGRFWRLRLMRLQLLRTQGFLSPLLFGAVFVLAAASFATAVAQPINDSLHAISLRNAKDYRLLSAMDDKGSSYDFTNINAWHITDPSLQDQIEKIYTAKYGDKELKNFEIDNVYIFVAPDGSDQAGDEKFLPFHVLFMGKHVNVDTSGTGESNLFFGGGARRNNNQTVPVAFKGSQVIPIMLHNPTLLDNINAIQGDLVELPGRSRASRRAAYQGCR